MPTLLIFLQSDPHRMAIPLGSIGLRGDGEMKACGLGFLQTAGE